VIPSPPPTPPPPAIVSNCGTVRHDGARDVTSAILNTAVGAVLPSAITGVGGTAALPSAIAGVGGAAANKAADATVWTGLEADIENTTPMTIVGIRLGVKMEDDAYNYYDVPVTIAPNGDATASQRLARGTIKIGVSSCSVVRVNFSDGTSWYAPSPTPP
jgi:hypothetical protein